MLKLLKYQYPSLLWTGVILFICNMRIDQRVTGSGVFFVGFDKLTHCGCFFVLTVFLLLGRTRQRNTYSYSVGTILVVLAVNAALGGLIEVVQRYLFTYRSAEWWDFGCDMLGCLMALFAYVTLHRMNSLEMHHPPSTHYIRHKKMTVSIPLGEQEQTE